MLWFRATFQPATCWKILVIGISESGHMKLTGKTIKTLFICESVIYRHRSFPLLPNGKWANYGHTSEYEEETRHVKTAKVKASNRVVWQEQEILALPGKVAIFVQWNPEPVFWEMKIEVVYIQVCSKNHTSLVLSKYEKCSLRSI